MKARSFFFILLVSQPSLFAGRPSSQAPSPRRRSFKNAPIGSRSRRPIIPNPRSSNGWRASPGRSGSRSSWARGAPTAKLTSASISRSSSWSTPPSSRRRISPSPRTRRNARPIYQDKDIVKIPHLHRLRGRAGKGPHRRGPRQKRRGGPRRDHREMIGPMTSLDMTSL